MALFSLKNIDLGFGGPLLLDQVNLQIELGERVGLLGRNGAGKSSLLRLIHGDLDPQSGQVARQQNLKTSYLPQEVPVEFHGSVLEIVSSGLTAQDTNQPETWQNQIQVDQVISKMQLNPDVKFETLSAGMKRRVLLARGLVREPDVLLLDEPTNHLDIDAIQWLEDFLLRWGGTLVFVTHDRVFLQKMATRIVELDRGRLFDWDCAYTVFLERKEAMLQAEQAQNAVFDKKLAQEEQWIRQGIEARRTRNEGRVRALKRLREIRKERRDQIGKIRVQIQDERQSGRLVIEAQGIQYAYDHKTVIRDFSTVIRRGDKLGIIGPNGSGKTTLLRILLEELQPQQGSVELGTNLDIAYFDQLRRQLNEEQSILDNVGQGRDVVTINGKNRNIYGYLEDFLFPKERVHAPISALSGGERNRLLLARLFTQSTNLLVMDEPTNDLDIDTLEILEDLLLDFEGTMILVSHDRAFLNNLVTSILVMEGDGKVGEYVGGYDDWKQQATAAETVQKRGGSLSTAGLPKNKLPAAAQQEKRNQPTYKERKEQAARVSELAELPMKIEALENEQNELSKKMAESSFYQQSIESITAVTARLKELQAELEAAFQRWEELENQ
jgi:ATP-binding cassette subfamily F protein uup